MVWFTGLALAAALALLGTALWWLHAPLNLRASPGAQVLELEIELGTSPRQVAQAVAASGADVWPFALFGWFNWADFRILSVKWRRVRVISN